MIPLTMVSHLQHPQQVTLRWNCCSEQYKIYNS